MDVTLRVPRPDEFEKFLAAVSRGFGNQPRDDQFEKDLFRKRLFGDRALIACEGPEIIGTATSIPFKMVVPGGAVLPTGGVTCVTVAATHRRRGILRRMMDRTLKDILGWGEPMAILLASESVIYGRFGYGMAIQGERWSIDRRTADLLDLARPSGTVRWVERDAAEEIFPRVWAAAQKNRPGMTARDKDWWDARFYDPEHRRWGGGPFFFVVYEEGGRPAGYAIYRIRINWVNGTSAHVVNAVEVITATDSAYRAIWSFLLNIDLTGSVESWGRAVDEPLWWMLADPRRLQRSPYDQIWLRIMDAQVALSSRRYSTAGRIVLEVRDEFGGWIDGRYELDGGPEGAQCKRTTSSPDIVLGAADLAATYLGGVRLGPLMRAGRLEEVTPGAVARADTMLAWDPAPWCPQDF